MSYNYSNIDNEFELLATMEAGVYILVTFVIARMD